MIYPLLPAFLTGTLRAGPAFLGVVEGLAETVAAALKIVSGRASDRLPRRKPLVVAGYSLSSLVRPLVALATAPAHVLAVRLLDRVGKGVRSAPRDALVAEVVAPEDRGRAFGFQRAMDHAGAMVGPAARLRRDARDAATCASSSPSPRSPPSSPWRALVLGVREEPRPLARRDGEGRRTRGSGSPRAGAPPLPGRPGRLHPRQLLGRLPPAPRAGDGRRPRRDPRPLGAPPPREGGREHVGRFSFRPRRPPLRDPRRLGRLRARLRRLRRGRLAARDRGALRVLRPLPRPHRGGGARPRGRPRRRDDARPRVRPLPRGHGGDAAAGQPDHRSPVAALRRARRPRDGRRSRRPRRAGAAGVRARAPPRIPGASGRG